MSTPRPDSGNITDKRPFVWLVLGTILALFANGRWIFPMAAWLSPVFLMRFSRAQKPARGFLLVWLATAVTGVIAWKDAIPLEGAPYYTMMIVGALFGALLYLIDRLVAPRLNGFASTLVFPCASVAFEYLHVATSPYGANGSLALTQTNLPLLQVVSLTGMWGIMFLVTWLAPVVNWIWEGPLEFARIRTGTLFFAGVVITVFLYGSLRLSAFPPSGETIRIASVTSALPDPNIPSTADGWETFRTASTAKQADILHLSRQAVCTGARIIVWHEGEVFVLKEDEHVFVEQGGELARSEKVTLGMAIATFTRDFPKELAENKIVWIDTTGAVTFEYLKAKPTPTERCKAGDGRVKLLALPQSRIASTICFDLDFPAFIGQLGKADIDIMISPANDWDAISRTHPQQTSFRALEQGFSLIRPNTSTGLSAAYDYQGRLLASLDYARTRERILVADVPVQGVTTLYSVIGDLAAWLCVLGTLLAAGWAVRNRRRHMRLNGSGRHSTRL
jgi:apolipoprotein N-acyltransferase